MIWAYSSSIRISSRSEVISFAPLQRGTQQIGQARQQPIGPRHVNLHQCRDRVQRVEEEVRAQLRLEMCKLCLGQRFLQCEQTLPLLLRLGKGVEAEDQPHPQPIKHQQLDRLVEQHLRPGLVGRCSRRA
jgi:hypothetical protein